MIIVPQNLDAEDHDFFDFNPEYRYFDEISKLYKDVGASLASKVMWAIYLTEDPQSAFYGLKREDRRKQVESNYLQNDSFEWDQYEYLVVAYPTITMSPAKRRYKTLNDHFDTMLSQLKGEELKNASSFYRDLKKVYEGLIFVESTYDKEKQRQNDAGSSKEGKFV